MKIYHKKNIIDVMFPLVLLTIKKSLKNERKLSAIETHTHDNIFVIVNGKAKQNDRYSSNASLAKFILKFSL